MNYTTNYHLPQWVETDRILMDDFNDMTASSAMTPEPDVTAFALDEDPQEILTARDL